MRPRDLFRGNWGSMGEGVWAGAPKGSSCGPRVSTASRGRPTGSQGVKGWAYSVPGGQDRAGGPRGLRGASRGSHGAIGLV